jgi:GGDEF domain-containing protein
MRHNARLGFTRGDALLRAVVEALRGALPGATVLRLHADAFAALLGPTSGAHVEEAHRARVEEALAAAAAPFQGPGEGAVVGFTVALLELRVVQPAHWQVLGPLVWSELERALLLERLERASGLQQRRLELGGAIPGAPTRTVG